MAKNSSNANNFEVWNEKGRTFYFNEQYADALIAFKQAAVIAPQLATIWNNIGNALSAMKRQAEAFAAYDRAIALEAQCHSAWFNRGLLLAEMGAYGNALESYQKAIAIKPDPLYIHARDGIWLKKQLFAVGCVNEM